MGPEKKAPIRTGGRGPLELSFEDSDDVAPPHVAHAQ